MREKLLGTPRVEKEWSWPKTILFWAAIMAIALCLTVNNWPDGRSTRQITRKVEVDLSGLVDFMNDQWIGLNRVTEWLEMSEEENKCISIAATSCLGIPEDAGEDDASQENPRN